MLRATRLIDNATEAGNICQIFLHVHHVVSSFCEVILLKSFVPFLSFAFLCTSFLVKNEG